jgi:hypothetical protein
VRKAASAIGSRSTTTSPTRCGTSAPRPDFLLQPAGSDYPMVHLFDEPQFNTQDGYIGFMLDFFRRLRARGGCTPTSVFLCLHPSERFHLEILPREVCERSSSSYVTGFSEDLEVLEIVSPGVFDTHEA